MTILKTVFDSVAMEFKVKGLVAGPSKEYVSWIPILKVFDSNNFWMGIDEKGYWVVESAEGLHQITDQRHFRGVVILLERDMGEVKSTLKYSIERLNIKIDVDNFFPFFEIIRAGFEFGRPYWAEVAFNWFEKLPDNKKNLLCDSIIDMESANWSTQQLRHKAKKILKPLSQR